MLTRRARTQPIRARSAVALLAAASMLTLAACSSEDPTPAGPLPSVNRPSLPAVASQVPQGGVPRLIAVTIQDGQITGDTGDIDIEVNTFVRVTVISDVTDVLLVTGYDNREQIVVNDPTELEFLLDRAGRFDVLLERTQLKIATLVVN